MATVEYKNIGKKYGSITVMDGVSFSIEDGKFVVLLGPSGCGKTTLLRMTAGLEKVTKGDVLFSGIRMNDIHPRERDIAMVFQSYALYPQMTVYDNIAFSLQIRGVSKEEIQKRVHDAATVLGLMDYLERFPKALSGGQRQRVAMGRALVRQPKVFLFDEPLSNLDAKLRGQMRQEIRRLHDQLETTTIYVTHDQIEAMTMADVIVVMRDGSVEQMGSPDDVYDRPLNMFVADFIGSPSINFLTGSIEINESKKKFVSGDLSLPISADIPVIDGQDVTVGIRPLDITLQQGSPYKARVEHLENTGAERHVHCQLGGYPISIVSSDRISCKKGDEVGLGIEMDKLHVFDTKTGDRV